MKNTNKKIAVITDNDKKQNRIDFAIKFNNQNHNQHIFMSDDINQGWTWEACFYALNKELLDDLIKVDEKAEYSFHNGNYDKVLGKMFNNKVDAAYKMLNSEKEFKVPKYIQDAIEWLRK